MAAMLSKCDTLPATLGRDYDPVWLGPPDGAYLAV
jgi:hypothetical protein